MYLINIFPIPNIEMEQKQTMHMFLTHLVESNPTYRKAAIEAPGYKILDNSLIELGGAVDLDRVLSAAKLIHADEIILPDVFQKGPETLEAVAEAVRYLKYLYPGGIPYKVMAVAQGRNLHEWFLCYSKLLEIPEIDVIGIPKVCAKMHPQGRAYFVKQLCNLGAKEHHLLGLWYSFAEFSAYSQDVLNKIRSCDTCHLSYLAKHGLNIMDVRPDGFTVDLVNDKVDYSKIDPVVTWMLHREIGGIKL